MNQSLDQLLTRLWNHMSSRRRSHFILLLFLMIIVSVAEIISIGAVLPFLAILMDPASVYENSIAQPIIQVMGFTDPKQLILPITFSFGIAAFVAGALRLFLLWSTTRLSFATGADLSSEIYRRTLYQPYAIHVNRNSGEVINSILSKVSISVYTINMVINLISSSVMLIGVLIAIFYVDPVIAISAFGGFGLIYVLIINLTQNRLLLNSQIVARESSFVMKSLQEGLGGIRDVLIDGSQDTYCQLYRRADQPLRQAQGNTAFINYSPRFGMEALGMLLIAGLAYSLAKQEDGVAKAIPVLGALALAAQRVLPLLQQAYSSWSSILGGQASLEDTLELLAQPLPNSTGLAAVNLLTYQHKINLKQISFRYSPDTPWVLNKINLSISKGSRIGFIGETGSGKSTLIDIIMGLLQPTDGVLSIDDQDITYKNQRNWQAHIAHVPQSIFLADSTIEENIAFGVPKDQIDHQRVRQAAYQAQIANHIDSLPKKYKTIVGERGIRLSGGQKQRIGIARALYKQADVIIFDEATSALDQETERSVMSAIESLSDDLTLLIIAHRIDTLKNCSDIVEVTNGVITRICKFEEININN